MNKKPKKQFVMLGERYENGKISKNEYYSVIDFVGKLKNRICLVPRRYTFWDKLARKEDYLKHKEQDLVNKSFKVIEERLIGHISDMIHEDGFGKNKKR